MERYQTSCYNKYKGETYNYELIVLYVHFRQNASADAIRLSFSKRSKNICFIADMA